MRGSYTRGVLFVHSTPPALCPHIEWALGTALGQESLPLLEGGADEQEFLGRVAVLAHDAAGNLAPADRGLGLGLLGDKNGLAVGILALDDLVDQGGRRHARTRHELGTHAVGVDGGRAQRGDGRTRPGRRSP